MTDMETKAFECGEIAANLYVQEFGSTPKEHGAEVVGDWDSIAFEDDWNAISGFADRDADGDFPTFLEAWKRGFWA